ncbi:MAG: hypothetical protein Q9162_006947 [Coniocarpon cinnabarinum]
MDNKKDSRKRSKFLQVPGQDKTAKTGLRERSPLPDKGQRHLILHDKENPPIEVQKTDKDGAHVLIRGDNLGKPTDEKKALILETFNAHKEEIQKVTHHTDETILKYRWRKEAFSFGHSKIGMGKWHVDVKEPYKKKLQDMRDEEKKKNTEDDGENE